LRQFHDRMTAQIFACGGTVEKYIGDEIFAVFGLPEVGPDDAANALSCADMMLTALDRWNEERCEAGEPPLAIGIGLNYGAAVIPDIRGSSPRMTVEGVITLRWKPLLAGQRKHQRFVGLGAIGSRGRIPQSMHEIYIHRHLALDQGQQLG